MRIWKEFTVEVAHRLPNLPPEHKCARLHGHSIRFRLHVEGRKDPTTGWVTDFGGLMRATGDMLLQELDHRYLNEIPGLENPTAENLAEWIWDRVAVTALGGNANDFRLCTVEVFETCTSGVWYERKARWG